jgi:hypothetical protein
MVSSADIGASAYSVIVEGAVDPLALCEEGSVVPLAELVLVLVVSSLE